MLKAANTRVLGFTLYVVGEGLQKKVDDFAPKWPLRWRPPRLGPEVDRAAGLPGTGKPASDVPASKRKAGTLNPFFKEPFMSVAQPAHKRILLKLSGEALMGDDAFGSTARPS